MMNENLRNRRERLGLTKKEVAKEVGVSAGYYAMIENGARKIDNVSLGIANKIADTLMCNMEDLIETENHDNVEVR